MTEPDGDPPQPTTIHTLAFVLGMLSVALLMVGCFLEPQGVAIDPETGLPSNLPLLYGIYGTALALLLAMILPRHVRLPVDEPGLPVCAHCMLPTRVGVHFCPRDSTPVTVFAATVGYENVFAQAWIIGKAIRHPTRWVHVIGVALFTAPVAVGLPVALIVGSLIHTDFYLGEFVAWGALTWFVYTPVLVFCLHNWRRYRLDPASAPAESTYGSPPWWTYDRWWTLPGNEQDGEDDSPAAEDGTTPPPPD